MTTGLALMACLMSPSALRNAAESSVVMSAHGSCHR